MPIVLSRTSTRAASPRRSTTSRTSATRWPGSTRRFEDEAARDRARKRLLAAAKRYGIVPVGFFAGQLRVQGSQAAAGRLVLELGRVASLADLQQRLRSELRDPSLEAFEWSGALGGYVGADDRPAVMPAAGTGRAVTLIDRRGRPMTALAHDPSTLADPELRKAVTSAISARGREPPAAGDRRCRRSRRADPAGRTAPS